MGYNHPTHICTMLCKENLWTTIAKEQQRQRLISMVNTRCDWWWDTTVAKYINTGCHVLQYSQPCLLCRSAFVHNRSLNHRNLAACSSDSTEGHRSWFLISSFDDIASQPDMLYSISYMSIQISGCSLWYHACICSDKNLINSTWKSNSSLPVQLLCTWTQCLIECHGMSGPRDKNKVVST